MEKIILSVLLFCVATGLVAAEAYTQSVPEAPNAIVKPVPDWQLEHQSEKKTSEGTEYVAVLEIPDLSLSLPLMKGFESPSREWTVDKETLGVKWLEPESTLWIHWCTTPQGNGNYRAEAHVIVSLTVSPARELLRESFQKWGKQGMGNYQKTSATYQLDKSGKWGITLRRTVTHDESEMEVREGAPLSVSYESGDRVRHYRIVQESLYQFGIEDQLGKHIHCEHRAWLDLGAPPLFDMTIPEYKIHEYSLQEVAEFLVLYLCPRYGQRPGDGTCLPEERDKMQTELLKCNSGLATNKGTRAKVTIPLFGFRAAIEPLIPEADFFPFR